MTIYTPNSLMVDLYRGKLDITTGSFRAILLNGSYEFVATHSKRSDIASFEIAAGNGYTTGGVAATFSDAVDAQTGFHTLTAAAVNLGTGPITARWVAYVRWRGGAASSDELIMLKDAGRAITFDGAFAVPAMALEHRPAR